MPPDAGGVGPEETVFQVLPGIPGFERPVHQVALPVGVCLFDGRSKLRQAPAAGLVDVPGHFHHDDIAEITRFDVLIGGVVIFAAASLRTYLNDDA